jgi:hypothetical protein
MGNVAHTLKRGGHLATLWKQPLQAKMRSQQKTMLALLVIIPPFADVVYHSQHMHSPSVYVQQASSCTPGLDRM